MHDIQSREDIAVLIDKFYQQVVIDPLIGHFFTSVVHLSWDIHIPVMVSFWSSILLGDGTYKGNPMIKHMELNRLQALEPAHFNRWLMLWEDTIHKNYDGEKATEAITRANTIAGIMQSKLKFQ